MRHRELTLDEVIKVAINSVEAGVVGKAEAEQMILDVANKKLTVITSELIRNNEVLGKMACSTNKVSYMKKVSISEKIKEASFSSISPGTVENRFRVIENMAGLNNEILASIS